MSMAQPVPKAGFRNENTYWRMVQEGREAEFHQKYEAAVAQARKELGRAYTNIINGKPHTSSGGTFDDTNPANTTEILGKFQKSTAEEARQAIKAAKAAFPAWSRTPWTERCKIFHKASDLMRQRKWEFAAWMSLENGKSRVESMNDVDEAIDFLSYYPTVYEENQGFHKTMGKPFPNEDCVSVLKPFGVWGVIPPFNFPVAITVGMTAGPVLVGNTAVLKPASDTPLVAARFMTLLADAGVPAGVVNFITGPGSSVGEEIVNNPDVSGVVFTGSKGVGMSAHAKMTSRNKPFIAEMGGKNAVVVTAKADLDKAVEGVGRSAFGFQGQKCSACSRVYIHESLKEEFTKRLVEWTKRTCTVGDPTKKENFMGPVVNAKSFEDYQKFVEKAKQGGRILIGGKTLKTGATANGHFVEATIVDGLPDDHFITKTELFVPITSLYTFKTLDEAIARVNDAEYGLTCGIFTEDPKEIDHFFEHVQAGVLYSNRRVGGSTGAIVGGQSFVGWKNSGTSGRGAGGPYYIMQFLREQSQTRVR
jgi:1-pyrroline-5-carboxylate dehydrogenase